MRNSFEEYNGRKDRLIHLLEDAKSFYDGIEDEKTSRSISDNIEVIQSGEFEVVVVGEFSAGKSTFLNALMREKYLPSYTKETTATINYLRNKSESDYPGIVYYMDGHTEELGKIDGETIEKYVSTKNEELDVSKAIKHFDLYLDSPFLENKVTLIDSPGLNGMKEGLGDITDAQIKRSHAVIFMFSAEQPGKRSDFEYLKKIKDEVNTVFLVLNKIDCIKQSENQTVEDTVNNLIASYKDVFPEDTFLPEIMPISAYKALVARSRKNLDYPMDHFNLTQEEKEILERESLMEPFERKLLRFLTNGEKTIMQIREPLARLTTNLEKSLEKIKNEMNVIENEKSALELDNKIIAAEDAARALEEELGNNRSEIRKAVKTVERDILEYLDGEIENVSRKVNAQVDGLSSVQALDDELADLNHIIERSVRELVQKLDGRFRELFFDQVQEQYMSVVFKLEEQLESLEAGAFSFESHINVTANDIQSGYDNFREEIKKLETQISQIETDMKRDGLKEDELIELSAKAEHLNKKYERIRQSQSELQSTFSPPEVISRQKTGVKTIERQGLLGKGMDFVLGKKTVEYSYDEVDDSERKEYIKDFQAQQAKYSKEQETLEKHLEAYYGIDKKRERVEKMREEKQEELRWLRQKEKDMVNEFNEKLDKKNEKEVKRIKSKMKRQIEDSLGEIKPTMKQILKESRNRYTAVLQDLLEQGISSQIESKRQEAENLKKLRQDAKEGKEEILNGKRDNEKSASALLEKSRMLLDEINGIIVEKREYQTI